MYYTRILILLVIWNLLPSCFPLPSAHRAEIDKLLPQISIGKSNRNEIISILGKPDLERDKYIIYLRREYDAGLFSVVFKLSGPLVTGKEYMDLYFHFDNYGTLKDYRVFHYNHGLGAVS
jgi:hypothetical protein